jgi:glycosyltransferase involved in cell wall biosynthesis
MRQNLRKDKLNVLTVPTHESFEEGLAKTGHNFYAIRTEQTKTWETKYRPLPANYTLLDKSKTPEEQLPVDVEFDCVLAQSKFGHFQILAPIAHKYGLPLIALEHTAPTNPNLKSPSTLNQLKQMSGNRNVFISDWSMREWGYTEGDVIHHGIDTEQFKDLGLQREVRILSVVNDWINRGPILGFDLYRQITQGLPIMPVGATPGLSEPAKSTEELVHFYNTSRIFLNTSIISPIPTSLLEAMSTGCAVVSTDNCLITDVIQNGYNGFKSNNPAELRHYLEVLMGDPELAKRLGQNARKTILEKFSLDRFVSEWNKLFYETVRDYR